MKTHGRYKTPEYKAWCDMKGRCTNHHHKSYMRYGGRGIRVCRRWMASFLEFLRDMGPRPKGGYSIEREDNNGNYCKKNCRWATRTEQSRNKSNVALIGGRTLVELAAETGLPYPTLRSRWLSGLRGYDLTRPKEKTSKYFGVSWRKGWVVAVYKNHRQVVMKTDNEDFAGLLWVMLKYQLDQEPTCKRANTRNWHA